MIVLAGLLGINLDGDDWSAIIAALALAVAIWSLIRARTADETAARAVTAAEQSAAAATDTATASARSASAAEQSAAATVASTDAALRSATAAEESAGHATRSAAAAEALVSVHEQVLRIEERRAMHEDREWIGRDSPRFVAVSDGENDWWLGDDYELGGVLVNAGAVIATVSNVTLELPSGGRANGSIERFPLHAMGGGETIISVGPGKGLRIDFRVTDGSLDLAAAGGVNPRVTIPWESDELGVTGTCTVELLRRPGGVTSAARFKPRAVETAK